MKEEADKLMNWIFKIDEISANVYKVWGVDRLGRNVEKIGTGPEMLLAECKAGALKLSSGLRNEKL